MNAWVLAVLLCANASAAVVVETGGAAASAGAASGAVGASLGAGSLPSPITAVPVASVLAPALNVGAVISAFPGQAAAVLPAGALGLAPAPLPTLPAAAAAQTAPSAPSAVPGAEGAAPAPAAAPNDALPPPSATAPRATAALGPGTKIRSASTGAAARVLSPESVPGASDELDRAPAESASAFGRRVFDRSADRAALADGAPAASGPSSAATSRRAPALTPSSARLASAALAGPAADGPAAGETLRDAVASPFVNGSSPRVLAFPAPEGSAPGAAGVPAAGAAAFGLDPVAAASVPAAPALAPRAFDRLSLELGSGLVVKVRAALGLNAAPAAPSFAAGTIPAAPRAAFAPAAREGARVPVTSTEWLERRGLLESLSVADEAALQTAAAAPAVPAPTVASVPALVLDPTSPASVPAYAWWALAFLPAAAVLLIELV